MPAIDWKLDGLSAWSDHALLLLRLVVGSFLIWGVLDNILSAARMAEFQAFLSQQGFVMPALMARLSVWAQFLIGCGFVLGLLCRWAGLLCAVNFLVAIIMVDAAGGIRAAFPSAALVCIGLLMASLGPGRFALERYLPRA